MDYFATLAMTKQRSVFQVTKALVSCKSDRLPEVPVNREEKDCRDCRDSKGNREQLFTLLPLISFKSL